MKRFLLLMLVGLAAVAQAGKIYIYKDASGKTVYSDLPPQGTQAEQRNLGANVIDTSGYPYAVQQAIKNNPVTLWVNSCGSLCDDARALLKSRGVPFTESDPGLTREKFEAFKKLTGGTSIPVLQIGSRIIQNFNPSAWNTALTDAGYPQNIPPALRTGKPTAP